MKFIPKKYMDIIGEVYKDSDGYWAFTKAGYYFEGMGAHTAHESNQKALMAMIRTARPCFCIQCKVLDSMKKGAAKK